MLVFNNLRPAWSCLSLIICSSFVTSSTPPSPLGGGGENTQLAQKILMYRSGEGFCEEIFKLWGRSNKWQWTKPAKNCYRTKWQYKSTYLVLSWKTRFWRYELRLDYPSEEELEERSANNRTSHVNSATTRLIERYSASAKLRETHVCFFDFHEIGEPPIEI